MLGVLLWLIREHRAERGERDKEHRAERTEWKADMRSDRKDNTDATNRLADALHALESSLKDKR